MAYKAPDPIFEEALEWLLHFDAEEVSEADRHRFECWLAADTRHKDAYAQAQAFWGRFDVLKPEVKKIQRARNLRRRAVLGGLAALVAVPAAFTIARHFPRADYTTGVGERRQITLADGSLVELGSRTALSVAFTGDARHLLLHEGQAFFQVAPDPVRVFTVESAGGTVTALGTAFDVKKLGGEVTVTVLEHAVAVRSNGRGVAVESGWQVYYTGSGIQSPEPADLDAAMGWRGDRLLFNDVPLRTVLKELERYRSGAIVLTDASIGNLSITAIFDVPEADQALERIARTVPIEVRDIGGLVTFVYGR